MSQECEHNLSKPDFNPSLTRFKIQLIALWVYFELCRAAKSQLFATHLGTMFPIYVSLDFQNSITIRSIPCPYIVFPVHISFLQEETVILSLYNPLQHAVPIRLEFCSSEEKTFPKMTAQVCTTDVIVRKESHLLSVI